MPEILNELPKRAGGRTARYPWAEWTDGRVYKFTALELDDEWGISPKGFVAAARGHADRRGLRSRSRMLENGRAVAIQFVKAKP